MPYQSTWVNPYMQGLQQPYGQQMAPVQQPQQVAGWGQPSTWPQQQPVNGIIKVKGESSALQVQLPPNSTSQPLIDASFDGKRGVMYVVSTDGTGTKTVEAFDFVPHVEQQPIQIDGANFVSRQEFDQFVSRVSVALGALNGTYGPVQAAGPAGGPVSADGTAQVDSVGRPNAARQDGVGPVQQVPDARR